MYNFNHSWIHEMPEGTVKNNRKETQFNVYDKCIGIKSEEIPTIIAETAKKYPYLSHNKKMVTAVLQSLSQTPFFLRNKPTPLISSLHYLNAVISPQVQRTDLIFAIAAIEAPLGVRGVRVKNSFKIFPTGAQTKGFRSFKLESQRQAEAIDNALVSLADTPQHELANIQSCTNSLIKAFEIRAKAMELFRLHENGFSYAGGKKKLSMSDRDYSTAYKLLTDFGLVRPRRIIRAKSVSLTPENVEFIKKLSAKQSSLPSDIINEMLDKLRLAQPS